MTSQIEKLNQRLDAQGSRVRLLEQRYAGESPLTFLSPEAKQALGNRLKALSVNFCALAVDALAERLQVSGFLINGTHDESLWEAWRSLGMEDGSAQVHVDALAVGRSAVTVWGDGFGPTVNPEAPAQIVTDRHPVTREVVAAWKRWTADGKAYGVLYGPEAVVSYVSKAGVPEGGTVPPTGWEQTDRLPNPLGVVPVVPFTNRGRVADVHGVSEMTPIADLNDALVKVMTDSLVSSEHTARQRRWATGLEVVEDADGNALNPFSDESTKLWQSEDPETRFGAFPGADLSSYGSLVNTITQQIAALSGLPAQMLGMNADQATSADAIRAAEARLVAKAHARMVTFGRSWAQVASLMHAVTHGGDPRRVRAEVVWSDPSTRSEAATADSVTKLLNAGIIPTAEAQARLGYSPEKIADLARQGAAETALRVSAQTPATPRPEAA
ncbi:phage portal protein [Nocardioides sp. URHA0032]|uniref:phage portal protein n=1 Tax=Nocardioides sp. URHA0032 TaxID=1380388 RepID=UPI0006844ADA|nr:phage portal protein [Nocardioides sp. URHA0032]